MNFDTWIHVLELMIIIITASVIYYTKRTPCR